MPREAKCPACGNVIGRPADLDEALDLMYEHLDVCLPSAAIRRDLGGH